MPADPTVASTAGGLRNCNGAAFDSFKKYAAHFLNRLRRTEPKEAPYAVTGDKSETFRELLFCTSKFLNYVDSSQGFSRPHKKSVKKI